MDHEPSTYSGAPDECIFHWPTKRSECTICLPYRLGRVVYSTLEGAKSARDQALRVYPGCEDQLKIIHRETGREEP